jgi:hypothetical protein
MTLEQIIASRADADSLPSKCRLAREHRPRRENLAMPSIQIDNLEEPIDVQKLRITEPADQAR